MFSKRHVAFMLLESTRILSEQAPEMAAVPSTAEADIAASTPAPTPSPMPGQDAGGQTPMSVTGEPLTIDSVINRLNVIRGGKSFADPEVYGQLTTMFKTMPDQDKITLDRILADVGKTVINVPQDQGQQEPPEAQNIRATQMPMNAAPPGQSAPSTPAMPAAAPAPIAAV